MGDLARESAKLRNAGHWPLSERALTLACHNLFFFFLCFFAIRSTSACSLCEDRGSHATYFRMDMMVDDTEVEGGATSIDP